MNSTSSVSGKSLSVPATVNHSQAPSTSAAAIGFDSTRRPSPSQGQGSSQPQAIPRKNQGSRKQHRNMRRAGQNSSGRLDDEDDMAEIRAVRNASSRRGQTSITHLMNYALPPRPYYDSHHAPSSRSYRRNPTYGAMDKARYVHANYRFVVSPSGNYSQQAVDADEHLDWADILQVIASAESQQTSCPICLSEPVAPRMAKCGHIFCLPCLIRFMNSGPREDIHGPVEKKQNRWRKCPICDDTVFISDVKPVKFYAGQESPLPRPGDDVVLRLMMRSAKSTLALPKEGAAEVINSSDDVPWHFAAGVLDYARIMKGTGGYMTEEFDREIEELIKQEKEDELLFHEDNEWTQRSIKAVNLAKEKVVGLGDAEVAVSIRAAAASGSHHRQEQDFYFYTSPPHLYLSPLDIRILKTKYGSFSDFPSTLLPRVEHISTGHVVDDALRKRAKYLGHLPYGCLISFLECDWTDIVPAETLDQFASDIERRRKRNKDKAAQEERERVQAEKIEAAAIRDARRNFGALDEEVTVRFGNSAVNESAVNMDDFLPLGAEGTTPPNPRPGFGFLSEVSTSPSGSRTVWGTPAIVGTPDPVAVAVAERARTPANDGWLKDTEVLNTREDAHLALQMEGLGVTEAAGTAAGGSGHGGGGKKKKQKKITLMSTGGRRGN
ncbi:RING-15 protein [Rhypophila decipiens]|uniref:RING-15 protein n=1 Tax=Rhypophila decipiens TaxID=261697 RepID=A0AAN7B5T2_9PEZI|nr:RING-15 protein [Rhypophila decipiens]